MIKRKKSNENGIWSDNFNKEEAQMLSEQSLENITRKTVYRNVLKEASETRSDENKKKAKEDESNDTEENQKSKRPAMAKYSPLDPEILDLMYGHRDRKTENKIDPIKREDNVKKKRNFID